MKYLSNNEIKDFVKDIVIDRLHDYKDIEVYGCDLGYTLLETYNIDGVYFYSTDKAIDFISKHFRDFGEIVEEIIFHLGSENIPNVFEYPDRFCVVCFLEVASYILGQCKYVEDNWNNSFEITDEVIKTIENELSEV